MRNIMTLHLYSIVVGFFVCAASVQAQTVSVSTPRHFSAVVPKYWVNGEIVSGNTRLSLVAPTGTPTAECSVVVLELPGMKKQSQSEINQIMLENPSPSEMAAQLSHQYNNVKVTSAVKTFISGYPAYLFNLQYSVGTPSGEMWTKGTVYTFGTTPGLVWSISCGATGRNINEAIKGFSYWQSEINLFPTNVKIIRK